MVSSLSTSPLCASSVLFSDYSSSESSLSLSSSTSSELMSVYPRYRKEFNLHDPDLIPKFADKLGRHGNLTIYIRKAKSCHDFKKSLNSKLDTKNIESVWVNWYHHWSPIITDILNADLQRHDVIKKIDRTEDPELLEKYRDEFWKSSEQLQKLIDIARAVTIRDKTFLGSYFDNRWDAFTVFSRSLRIDSFFKGYIIEYELAPPPSEMITLLNSGTPAIISLTHKDGKNSIKMVKIPQGHHQQIKLKKILDASYPILLSILEKMTPSQIDDDPTPALHRDQLESC